MTATSVFTPTAVTRSWSAVHRAAAMLFVIAVFVAIAFTAGRISAPDHHGSSVIAPPTAAVPSPSGAGASPCRVGIPC
jgi:hypothetical protein